MRANATSSSPEWRKPADQGPTSRQRRTSTREGHRGSRGGRGRGRGGNTRGGGPSRKRSNSTSQDTVVTVPKLVVDPPAAADTPAESPPTPRSNSKSKPVRRHSVAVSEDSASVSSQTSARPPNRRRGSQPRRSSTATSNTPNKLLNVQTSSRKASTGPSSPNPAKDLPPHLTAATSATPTTELKSDIDALVERVRSVAMDRPHTPGSHIDWADDDDSLPDLYDWGYTEGTTAPAQSEEPPASISPNLEAVPLQSLVPEVKIEGEPSPDGTDPQELAPGPVSDVTPRARKVQKKRGIRPKGNPRTQQSPPALNLTESVSLDSSLSPIQSTTATTIPHTAKLQGQKRQNSRHNQGQTDNGGGRQRGQNGAAVASPMRNSFPAKRGPKADHAPPAQSQTLTQGPDIAHSVTDPHTESGSKGLESKEGTVPDDERKKGEPTETPRNADTSDSNSNPTATDHTLQEIEPEPTPNDIKPNSPLNQSNKRSSYNPSHSRSHTYGGRTQDGQQPPHSAPTPNFPHHSSNPTLNSRNPHSSSLRQSSSVRSSGLGPAPRSAGYERHNRNHSSPPGVGGVTRSPQSTRPVLTGDALSRLARSLGSVPGSPKRDPPPAS